MRELSIRQTRAALGEIEKLLEREGELVITRHGRAVARIVPVRPALLPTHAALRARMPRLQTPSVDLVRADRDERG